MAPTPLTIEVFSDIACPFCYLGKRRLEAALAERPSVQADWIWRTFVLDPDVDPTALGQPSLPHLAQKKGWTLEQTQEITRGVTEQGAALGIDFRFDLVRVLDTQDAHRLLHWARQFGKANALKELLFQAYFTRGWDLNDLAALAQLAAEAGLDGDEARAQLETGQYADDALADLKMADRFGIRGVPFFIFNRQFSVSGAQPVATFLRAIDQAVAGE